MRRYQPLTRDFRKHLRNNPTQAEKLLWVGLRNKQLGGYRFRRQYGIGKYILDFYCPEFRLGIELDGAVHDSYSQRQHDAERESVLMQEGISVIRIANATVVSNVQGVLLHILGVLNRMKTSSPDPSFREGGAKATQQEGGVL